MKTCCIAQPTYLPWTGYFNLISESDVFIFLDNIPLSKQSWQVRNRILLQKKEIWLSVPVCRSRSNQIIAEIQTHPTINWKHKHLRTLEQSYHSHPYGNLLLSFLKKFYESQTTYLSDFNIALIQSLTDLLGIESCFIKASEMGIQGQRSKRLIQMCETSHCTRYLSQEGSKQYIEEDGCFTHSSIHLDFQNFIPKAYSQKGQDDFISHLSILDAIANLGIEKSREYILN